MASIFQNAVNFIGTTLKQAATVDNLRDYRHASRLFVGGGTYRLNPKHSYLFHVFIDINESLASQYLSGRSNEVELGLMAKTADLPKFNFNVKAHNAYNRVNLVQNKVTYEDVSITFHDDSANVVRNFYYDYFKYYYRDSDYGTRTNLSTYAIPNKYSPQTVGNFGYQRRKESDTQFINAIRIYSLHQKKFSEYILVNPVIKSFRHSQHQNPSDNTMDHNMVVSYENVIYSDGIIAQTTPDGFALLEYYDRTLSPLRAKGGVKSIFGAGGLLDTAGSVLSDFENGQVGLGTILNAARAINTARSMNLKRSLVTELTGIYTNAATNAITGALPAIDQAIRTAINPTNPNGYQISTIPTVDGTVATRNAGLPNLSSVAALAGAAVFLNSTPITNRYQANPTVQNTRPAPTGYRLSFPSIPGAAAATGATGSTNLNIANNSAGLRNPSQQGQINNAGRLIDINRNIDSLNTVIRILGDEAAQAQTQITNTQASITNLTGRLAAANALTPPLVPPAGFDINVWTSDKNLLVSTLLQELRNMTVLNQLANTTYNTKVSEINAKRTELTTYQQERTRLGG